MQYLLPESGNGLPDFLDEALYSLPLWEGLQEQDGGVRAGTETAGGLERWPGCVLPEETAEGDLLPLGKRADQDCHV